jgi:hypothetical protein
LHLATISDWYVFGNSVSQLATHLAHIMRDSKNDVEFSIFKKIIAGKFEFIRHHTERNCSSLCFRQLEVLKSFNFPFNSVYPRI